MQVLNIVPNGSGYKYQNAEGQTLFTHHEFHQLVLGVLDENENPVSPICMSGDLGTATIQTAKDQGIHKKPGFFVAFADGVFTTKEKVKLIMDLSQDSDDWPLEGLFYWMEKLQYNTKALQTIHDLWAAKFKSKYAQQDLEDMDLEGHMKGNILGELKNCLSHLRKAEKYLSGAMTPDAK